MDVCSEPLDMLAYEVYIRYKLSENPNKKEREFLRMTEEGMMPVEVTQERLMQVLYQQAVLLFGRERAESLKPQLEERAGYLWLLFQNLPQPEDEPDGFFFAGSSILGEAVW